MSLQAQVRRLRGDFAGIRARAEEVERAALPPASPPPAPEPEEPRSSIRPLLLVLAAAACMAVTLRPVLRRRAVKTTPRISPHLTTRGADVLVFYGHGLPARLR